MQTYFSARSLKTNRVQHVLATAVVCSMLLVLSSCGIPPFRPGQPAPPLPPAYNGVSSAENSALLSVAEFFNDPILGHLVDQAVLNNRDLKYMEEEIRVARATILQRQGAYLPFVGFRADVGVDKPSFFTPLGAAERDLEYLPGRHFPDPLPNFLLGLDFFWQLDIWRELRNARDAAAARYAAAVERRNYFVTRMVADIAENYYGLMALDKRIENLNRIIELQEQSYEVAQARMKAGRGTELAVQRFLAEVRRNQSQKLIIAQEIIETENRINFLVNRFPQPVERNSDRFFDLTFPISVGVPAQLLQNRPDIRRADRELEAAGIDIKVARAHFFPRLDLYGQVGYQAFSPKYLFWTPDALIYNATAELIAPLVNKKAIQADFLSANARQLESLYNYQRVVLNAFTEVVNRVTMVENYGRSIAVKKQQLEALESSVEIARRLFQSARAEYVDVLFSQRDLAEARGVLIETKQQQLSAIANLYQALGGGVISPVPTHEPPQAGPPHGHSRWWNPFATAKTDHP